MKTETLLRRANGYRLLAMFEDAELELCKIPEEERSRDAVLAMRVALFQDWGRWNKMLEAAALLRNRNPEDADWWIAEAYAMRRCRSIEEARQVLLKGEENHPEEPCIQYNLGCYACVLGDRPEAVSRVRLAMSKDPSYEEMALLDDDLQEVRDDLL